MVGMAFLTRLRAALRAWIAGAPGWLGGVLAGAQAAAFSLALVVIPTWAIVAAAPSMDGALTPNWSVTTGFAVRWWLLGFGTPWEIDGVTVSLVPLGLTALTVLMLVALARRFADKTWTSWACGVASFAAVVAIVAAATAEPEHPVSPRVVSATAVAVVLGAPAVALGIWRAHGATLAWVHRLPVALRVGLRLGVATVGIQVWLAALVGAGWAVAGRHTVGDLATALGPDAVGGVAFAALQTLWVPTLAVWYMAWITGLGFTVGLTHFAPGHLVEGVLPQIPLAGALPSAYGGALTWAPLALVAGAAVLRWAMRSRMPSGLDRLVAMAVTLAVVFVATAVLGVAASGAIGPGTLADAGVAVWPFAGMSAALAGAGLVAGEAADRVAVWWGRPTAGRRATAPRPAAAREE